MEKSGQGKVGIDNSPKKGNFGWKTVQSFPKLKRMVFVPLNENRSVISSPSVDMSEETPLYGEQSQGVREE
jgi:hypothetical protein